MKVNFVESFENYLLTEKCVAANTFDAYRRDIVQLSAFIKSKKVLLKNITKKDVTYFIHSLKKRKLSARSMSRKVSTLKLFFGFLNKKFGWQDFSEGLSFPKIDKRLPRHLVEGDVKKLLEACNKDKSKIGFRNKMMIHLLYATGMRVSELVNLKVSDLHFDTSFIQVNGKGGKMRMIPLPEYSIRLLNFYLKEVRISFFLKSN